MNNEDNFYRTTDLGLVATLRLLGFTIVDMERHSGQIIFVFKTSKKLDGVINDFWNKKLMVEPLSLVNSLKDTKSLIYQK